VAARAGDGVFNGVLGNGGQAGARALALQGSSILAAGTAIDAGVDKVALQRLSADRRRAATAAGPL
jgi:hypothetical protein